MIHVAWPGTEPNEMRSTIETASSTLLPMPLETSLAKHVPPRDTHVHSRMPSTRILAPTEHIYSNVATKRMIQRVILGTSTCTAILVIITFVVFWRMQQKRLRHKLVMLSILGCFIRGLWYFIFSIAVTAGLQVHSSSGICQATGFFIHVGNEMTDIATLLITVHGALQIFRPSVSTMDVDDGLYDYRQYCYAAIACIPLILASIPFLNPGPAYTAQGAFCSLPSSPIWYRIALSWAPRYLIALTIVCLSIAVYVHVELKFRSFAKSQRASRTSIAFPSGLPPLLFPNQRFAKERQIEPIQEVPQATGEPLPTMSIPKFDEEKEDSVDPLHRTSDVTCSKVHDGDNDASCESPFTMGTTTSSPGRKISIATTMSRDTASTSNTHKSRGSLPGIATLKRTHSALYKIKSPVASVAPHLTPMQKQEAERNALRRQLRLIFVYPMVYVVLWIPPCTLNAMQYSSRYAGHLPPWLGALSTVCLTLMGGIDCLVFFWREKPWRNSRSWSASTDYALSSSWNSQDLEKADDSRRCDEDENADAHRCDKPSVTSLTGLLPKKPRAAKVASTVAKQRAYERLALEKKDRVEQVRNSVDNDAGGRSRAVQPHEQPQANTKSQVDRRSRQWWDRQDSVSLW